MHNRRSLRKQTERASPMRSFASAQLLSDAALTLHQGPPSVGHQGVLNQTGAGWGFPESTLHLRSHGCFLDCRLPYSIYYPVFTITSERQARKGKELPVLKLIEARGTRFAITAHMIYTDERPQGNFTEFLVDHYDHRSAQDTLTAGVDAYAGVCFRADAEELERHCTLYNFIFVRREGGKEVGTLYCVPKLSTKSAPSTQSP